MRDAPRHHPCTRASHNKEVGCLFPPSVGLLAQLREPFSAVSRVLLDELQASFWFWQRWCFDVDSEHGPKPQILADALMHHLLMNTTSPWIITAGAHRKIVIPELAPHADHFDSFTCVRFH